MPPSDDIRENLGYEVRGTFRAFENALITYLSTTDISVAYFHILRQDWTDEGIPQHELSSLAFMSRSVTSQVVQKMANDELIKRVEDSQNSRKKIIFLTDKGLEYRHSVIAGALAIPRTASEDISDQDLEIFMRVLNTIRLNLEV